MDGRRVGGVLRKRNEIFWVISNADSSDHELHRIVGKQTFVEEIPILVNKLGQLLITELICVNM